MMFPYIQEYEKQMAVYGVPVQPLETEGIPTVNTILEEETGPEDIKQELPNVDHGNFQLDNFYEEDNQAVYLSDPMLSSVPLEYQHSSSSLSSPTSSSVSSPCSSLDNFDI